MASALCASGFAANTARVRYESADGLTALQYDPTCTGALAWHYTDAHAADRVMLCEATCDRLRSLGATVVQLEYPCTYPIAL